MSNVICTKRKFCLQHLDGIECRWHHKEFNLRQLKTAWDDQKHFHDLIKLNFNQTQGVCCAQQRQSLCHVNVCIHIPRLIKKILPYFTSAGCKEPRCKAKCLELWNSWWGDALTSLSMANAKHLNTNRRKNKANVIKKSIVLYLESFVDLKYIGNQVICQLLKQKKSAMMPHQDFQQHCPHVELQTISWRIHEIVSLLTLSNTNEQSKKLISLVIGSPLVV